MTTEKQNNAPIKYGKIPWAMSTITRNLSLQETHILAEVMDQVGERVNALFKTKADENGNRFLFKEEDFDDSGMAYIDLPMSTLTDRRDCYKYVEAVAEKLHETSIRFSEETDTEVLRHNMNLFADVISVTKKTSTGKERRTGTLRLVISKYQAKYFFNFARYSRYIKAVIRNCKSVYTARLYWLITAYRDFGEWTVKYSKLREILGFYVEDPETHKMVDGPLYSEYRLFKRRILTTAENELKQLRDEGEVDCFFEIEEIFTTDKSTPDKIIFHIQKSQMGIEESLRLLESKESIELENKLKDYFSFTNADCTSIIKQLSPDEFISFSQRVDEIHDHITKMQAEDKRVSVKKYALTSIKNEIESMHSPQPSFQFRDDEQVPKAKETEYTEVTNEPKTPPQQVQAPQLSDEQKQKWSEFNVEMKASLSLKNYDFWSKGIRLWSIHNNTINLVLPTSFYETELKARYETEIRTPFQTVFGAEASISFITNVNYFEVALPLM